MTASGRNQSLRDEVLILVCDGADARSTASAADLDSLRRLHVLRGELAGSGELMSAEGLEGAPTAWSSRP